MPVSWIAASRATPKPTLVSSNRGRGGPGSVLPLVDVTALIRHRGPCRPLHRPRPAGCSALASRITQSATTRRRSTPAGCPASPSRSAHPHPAPTAHPLAYPSPSMPTRTVPSASLPAPRGLTQRLIVGDRVEYANGVARTAVRRPLDSDDPAARTCGRDLSRMSPSRRSHRHIGPRTAERVRYNPIMDCAGNCTRPLTSLHKHMQINRFCFHGSVRCGIHASRVELTSDFPCGRRHGRAAFPCATAARFPADSAR